MKSAGIFLLLCSASTLIYWHDPGKPFRIVEDAEAKVSFFDYKMEVLVEVISLRNPYLVNLASQRALFSTKMKRKGRNLICI